MVVASGLKCPNLLHEMPDADSRSAPDDSLVGKESAPASREAKFPVVGVGASAGGLEALIQLLGALPVDTGIALVIVQHLSPERDSNLAPILSRATRMRVAEVRDEPAVEPNHIYVIPPGRDMIIAGGKLRLQPQERGPQHRGIDHFFRSLAADCGNKAIGVVLSGGLSDGTLGLEEIKAEGGITFAQDESAVHESMPLSAVASGCVDFVLSPEEIAGEITRIARHRSVLPAPIAEGEQEPARSRIARIVHKATGVDFTHYKANTLDRRITRRMLLLKHETLEAYEAHLESVPEEVEALFQDILINVTSFFRDPAAFEVLKRTVFPKMIAECQAKAPLRIWTLGCSTGEEAYSLAMTFAECAEAAGSDATLQIFATDLNHVVVTKARTGLYPKSISHDVSPERLQRFFTEEEAGWRICKSIRDRCIFSRHNVLADPPFSRVDLISCRNLLIYLEPVLQQQVIPLLHYALKAGGYLWLGGSETAGTSQALFEVEDARQRIYSRLPGASPSANRFRTAAQEGRTDPMSRLLPGVRTIPRNELAREAERFLLRRYSPPGVVITPALEIVQFLGDTGPYLAPAAGAANLNLLKMLREGLLVGVRAGIVQAEQEQRSHRTESLRVKADGLHRSVAVEVIPLKSGANQENGFLVLFHEALKEFPSAAPAEAAPLLKDADEDEVSRITQELAATRDYLQSVIEMQESANEELQSANEEAQSSNEEMQSVNEELETSKEEIQSSNEELATVNDELNNRGLELIKLNESLQLARDYAENIVGSVRMPLLVLDSKLHVKTANNAFYETFQVAANRTEGRLVYDLGNGQWNIPALRTLLEESLAQQERIDHFEVSHTFENIGQRIMILNARRLSQVPGSEPMIVLAIEDITGRTQAEIALHESETRFRTAVSIVSSHLWTNNALGMMEGPQPGWSHFTGQAEEEYQGYGWAKAVHPEDAQPTIDAWEKAVREKRLFDFEHRLRRSDGEWRLCSIKAMPLFGDDGNIREWVGVHTDITERKQYEEVLRTSEESLRAFVTASSEVVYRMSADWSEMHQLHGRNFIADSEESNRNWLGDYIYPEDQAEVLAVVHEAIRTKRVFQLEHRVRRVDGSIGWTHSKAVPLFDRDGEIIEWFGAASDVTERRQAEATIRASEAFNRSIIESSPDCITVLDLEGNLLSLESGRELLGIDDVTPFLNKSWIDLWEGEHRIAAQAAVTSAVATGEGKFAGYFPTMHGEPKWWDIAISPFYDGEGKFTRLLAVLRDVTKRHQLEDSLIARASDLVRADRNKDEFLAMLAHELRNPLAPLRNAAEILHSLGAASTACEQAQEILVRQIGNMTRMIDDLLDVSRITQGKIELRPQLVALDVVLGAAAHQARPGIEERHQELSMSLPDEPIFLHADATRLDQVFGNLFTNASKYSATGCRIEVRAERSPLHGEPAEVIISVRDNGMGIAPELLPRIFDLFVQATRSLDRTHGGLGIGLTLVHRLVKLHGGSVEARSEGLGCGSEFIVRLPVLPDARPVEIRPPPSAPVEAPCRMLIVDDNKDAADTMAMLQGMRGHETRTAHCGTDAIAIAAEFSPEVVLLDIGLPGMDGYQVAAHLRSLPEMSGALLVALSGYGSPQDIAKALAAGFDEYLVKPGDLRALQGWLRRRSSGSK